MSEAELQNLCDIIIGFGTGRKAQEKKGQLFRELMCVKEVCEAQHATMRHFEEYVIVYSALDGACITLILAGSSPSSAFSPPPKMLT
jgi:hypothetical protein